MPCNRRELLNLGAGSVATGLLSTTPLAHAGTKTTKIITIYGILCLQSQEDPLWPAYGLVMRSPAPQSSWI